MEQYGAVSKGSFDVAKETDCWAVIEKAADARMSHLGEMVKYRLYDETVLVEAQKSLQKIVETGAGDKDDLRELRLGMDQLVMGLIDGKIHLSEEELNTIRKLAKKLDKIAGLE